MFRRLRAPWRARGDESFARPGPGAGAREITAADPLYIVDAEKCTECVGAHDAPRCIEVCPVSDCIVPDPDHRETRQTLEAKYARLHA